MYRTEPWTVLIYSTHDVSCIKSFLHLNSDQCIWHKPDTHDIYICIYALIYKRTVFLIYMNWTIELSICTVTVGSTASVGGLLHTDMMLQNYTRNTCIIDAKCIPMNSLCGAWSTGAHWTPEVCATKLGWYLCVCPWCVANHTVLPCNIYEKSCFVDIYLKIIQFQCQPKHTDLAGAEFYRLLCRKF